MKTAYLLFAASVVAASVPAAAQNVPVGYGDYVAITSVSVDDGHGVDYAMYLSTKWKAQEEFAKAQGWITSYEVLANPFKRAGEPDLYLIERFRTLADATEQTKRDDIMRNHMKMDDTQADADSGSRAKYRHVTATELLQVLTLK